MISPQSYNDYGECRDQAIERERKFLEFMMGAALIVLCPIVSIKYISEKIKERLK